MATEYERIKRQIAIKVASFAFNQPYGSLTESEQNVGLNIADQILAIDGIEIRRAHSRRPHTETAIHRFGEENDGYDEGKEVMWMAMLYDGWVKVIPKRSRA